MKQFKFLSAIAVCLSSWCIFACAASSVDAKTVRVGELSRTSSDFVYLVTGADLSPFSRASRDYFTLIVVTSTAEQHGCEMCLHWKSILRKVALAWFFDYLDTDYLFIAEVDLVDATNMPILDAMKISTVPQIWLIPPTDIAHEHQIDNADASAVNWSSSDLATQPHSVYQIPHIPLEDQAFEFADWLAISVQKPIFLRQENVHSKFMVTFAITFLLIMAVKKKGPSSFREIFSKGKVLRVFFFVFLYFLLAGIMFSLITQVPFLAKNDKGEVIYISGGNAYQFGVEVIIVGLSYFALGALTVALVYMCQYKVKTGALIYSETTKNMLVVFLAGALYFANSVLTSICLRKDHDYPYSHTRLF